MARKKGGTQLYGIVTALEKGRQHRGTAARRRVVKASSSIGRGCAQNYTSLMSFCNSRTGTLRGIGGVHIYYYLNMCLFHKGQKRYVHAIYRLYKTNFKNILELQAKQHCQFSPFSPFSRQMGRIGSAVQLVHSSKMAPRILIGAKPLFQLKSIDS